MDAVVNIVGILLGVLWFIYLEDKKKKKKIEHDCNPYVWHNDEVNERIHGIKPKGK